MAAPDFVAPNFYAESIASPRAEPRAISRRLFTGTMALAEATADFLTCATGFLATYHLCTFLSFGVQAHQQAPRIAAMGAAFGTFVVFLQLHDGAYRTGGGLLQIRETERAIRAPAQAAFLLWIVSLLLGLGIPGLTLLAAISLVPVLLIFEKRIFFFVVARLPRKESRVDRVVIYGAGDSVRGILSSLLYSPRLGLCPVAVIDDNSNLAGAGMLAMGYRGRPTIPVHSGPLTPSLLESLGCDLLVLATPDLPSHALTEAARAAKQIGSEVAFLSGQPASASQRTEWIDVDGLHFSSSKLALNPWYYAVVKRIADLVCSSILLLLLAPLLALIAILVHLDSPGPALFVQKRVGLNGALFEMYKFRSMFVDAAKYALSPTSSSDPRITRIGRFLRRASLDELPQLINVFMGTMSLVGPRPEMPFIVEGYDARQRQRLMVIPGITGPWQLSADRAFPIHSNIEYDLYYIRNRTLLMDIAILIHTLFFAIRGGI
jgi:exopolysaccharide biosynthesis polyprenyl glycosylphosphotransferase